MRARLAIDIDGVKKGKSLTPYTITASTSTSLIKMTFML